MKPYFALVTLVLLGACHAPVTLPENPTTAAPEATSLLAAAAVTEPSQLGGAVSAAFWVNPRQADDLLLIGATGTTGLEVYTLDGRRLGSNTDIEAGLVDVLPGFEDDTPLVLAYDRRQSSILPFILDRPNARLLPVPGSPIPIEDELVGLCSHRSRLSDNWFVFGVTDAGLVLQWELYRDAAGLAGRLLRSIPAGKGSGSCVVDPGDAELYLSDEEFGIWRFGAEPESDTTRAVFDLAQPWGRLGEEIKGIGLYRVDAARAYLLVADLGAEHIGVYSLPEGEYRGSVQIDGLSEPEGLAATHAGPAGGWLAVADEDESDGATDFKVLGWSALATSLTLDSTTGPIVEPAGNATVKPHLETPIVASYGDAADDPAIWVHPEDARLSLVLGTQKALGLHVYDLDGRELQFLPDGQINNVDVRDGFRLGGEQVSLAVASNRTYDSLSIYRIDPASRQLTAVAEGLIPAQMNDPYGLCMYQSRSGDTYAFVNNGGDGRFVQFRLFETPSGRVGAEAVREFVVGSQSEGCVADDETGVLYVAEEGFGIYRYSAEPDGGSERTVIDNIDGGRLTADVEGVALWIGPEGSGYLVASSQGADNFVVYRRDTDNAYVGTFHVVADPARGIDGVSETDGLEVTSAALGPDFPQGLMVAQDGRNIAPEERQNFKFVSWEDIIQALEPD